MMQDKVRRDLKLQVQLDTTDVQRTILKLFLGGTLVGIYSPETFIIPTQYSIPGLSEDPDDTFTPKRQKLYKGFNIADSAQETATTGFWWRGTATTAKKLIDDPQEMKDPQKTFYLQMAMVQLLVVLE